MEGWMDFSGNSINLFQHMWEEAHGFKSSAFVIKLKLGKFVAVADAN